MVNNYIKLNILYNISNGNKERTRDIEGKKTLSFKWYDEKNLKLQDGIVFYNWTKLFLSLSHYFDANQCISNGFLFNF